MQHQKQPLVSVIIPCYKQAHFLKESVQSILDQTFQDWEIIIVNDGSPDNTHDVAQEIIDLNPQYSIKLIDQENTGLAGARNSGINNASGKYIIPLDSDDQFADSYLEKAVRILERNPDIGIVYSLAEFFGNKVGSWSLKEFQFPEFLVENTIFCSAFFRKADWSKVGGYSLDMKYGWEDYDFWLSLIKISRKVFRIPEVLFFYRQHTISMVESMSHEAYIHSYNTIYKHHPSLYNDNIAVLFKRIIDHHFTIKNLYTYIQNLQTEIQQLQRSEPKNANIIPIKLGFKNIAIFIVDTSENSVQAIFCLLKNIFNYFNYSSIRHLGLIFDTSCVDVNELDSLIAEISLHISLEEEISCNLEECEPLLSAINLFEPTIWATISPHIDSYINLSESSLVLDNIEYIPELTIDSIECFIQNLA